MEGYLATFTFPDGSKDSKHFPELEGTSRIMVPKPTRMDFVELEIDRGHWSSKTVSFDLLWLRSGSSLRKITSVWGQIADIDWVLEQFPIEEFVLIAEEKFLAFRSETLKKLVVRSKVNNIFDGIHLPNLERLEITSEMKLVRHHIGVEFIGNSLYCDDGHGLKTKRGMVTSYSKFMEEYTLPDGFQISPRVKSARNIV